jgi:catechol 2,3-dioxygenase-like lactoylglutathione lyase family enzyme
VAIERYSFVAITTADLAAARAFWVEGMGFAVNEEETDHHFIVDAGGLRLCVDGPDGDIHRAGSSDPVLGLKVGSLAKTLADLARKGIQPTRGPIAAAKGSWATLQDPDGRTVILTEAD